MQYTHIYNITYRICICKYIFIYIPNLGHMVAAHKKKYHLFFVQLKCPVHQATSYLKMQIPGPALYVSSLLLSPFPVGGAGQESSTERKDVQEVLFPVPGNLESRKMCEKHPKAVWKIWRIEF